MARRSRRGPIRCKLLNALPQPVLAIAADGSIREVNTAAEHFFRHGARHAAALAPRRHSAVRLARHRPCRRRDADRRPSTDTRSSLDAPQPASGGIVDVYSSRRCRTERRRRDMMLQERTIAEKMDRQLTHRSAARSVIALAAMLAHEIKNPLSGIRGAAQLLEASGRRRGPRADAADLRRGRPHRQAGRSHGGVLRRAAGRARGRSTSTWCWITSSGWRRPASRATSASSRTTIRRCRRCCQPRPADPGVPQSGQERRRGHRRRTHRRRDRAHHRVSARRAAVAARGEGATGIAAARILRPGQRSGRARRTDAAICSIRSSPPSRRDRPGTCTGRQDHRRPRRHHRMRVAAATNAPSAC